ncbi:MAG: hypothetical protein MUP17_03415 [candidate division Zixibacteria bacterium]|nr:hypothetical protein [candidate division Zixibacteria bacterium]
METLLEIFLKHYKGNLQMELENNSENKSQKAEVEKEWMFPKSANRWDTVFRVVQLVLLVLALGLSIWNLKSSAKFSSNVENHLKNFDTLFASVENKMKALPQSVDKFDSTIRDLTDVVESQQKELSSSIGGLRKDVDLFSNSLISYERKLSEIVEASDKQLQLLKKTQASWEKEISRSPNLILFKDKAERVDSNKIHIIPAILNKGDQFSEKNNFILKVPKKFNFKSSGWTPYDSLSDPQTWSYRLNQFIGYYSDTTKWLISRPNNFDFTVELPAKKELSELNFDYTIFHEKGSQDGKLEVKLPK